MDISSRLDHAMQTAGFKSQMDLSRKSGVPQPTINRILKRVGKKGPEADTVRKLAAACAVSFDWLNEGIGEKDRESSNVEDGPNIRTERTYPVISWVEAGHWTELCDNFQPGHAEDWRPCHKNLGRCGYILRVKGKSMTAPDGEYTFPEGVLLYVNPEAEALPGKFVIVRRKGSGEATFKRLTQGDEGLLLEAINPDWPNRYLKLDEGDQICGVVMHAGFDMP